MDITRGVPLSLEADALFDKIVTRGRGGYCFELNGLFARLLRALGFGVTEYLARFLRDAEGEIPMRRHRVLRVRAEGQDYLADVGVGSRVPLSPLPLICGRVSAQGREKYKLERESFLGYVLYEWHDAAWKRVYSFTEEAQLDIDFVMPSFYCEAHPQSTFRERDMVHLFTEDGHKSVEGRELRVFTPSGVRVFHPASEAAYEELLGLHFGIRL